MEKKVAVDPFRYGKLDVATTLVQLGTAVAGVILAMNGNTAGLLALGSLAGGARGNLLFDLLKLLAGTTKTPKPPGAGLLAVVVLVVFFAGCGGISRQFLIDSRKAILTETGDYLAGCQQATVAPAFSVDWSDTVSFGGGLFAGCVENGRIVEFRCEGYQDDQTGKTKVKCAPLSLWERTPEGQ